MPSIEQQQGRPEIFDDPREWYAQAQAKSVSLGKVQVIVRFFRFPLHRTISLGGTLQLHSFAWFRAWFCSYFAALLWV